MTNFYDNSIILVVNNIQATLESMIPNYPLNFTRIIKNDEKDEFQIKQANETIKEAYISSSQKKYLFLCGSVFRREAQNALLKILEEPPQNIVFIIITNSKSSILPTIYSRIPYKYLKTSEMKEESSLDILNLDLKDIYSFLKQNQRVAKDEAKEIIESILLKVDKQNISLNQKQLELFSKSIKLIDLNSRPLNVLTTLCLSLLKK